jgi:hypothetical protein
MVPLSSQVFTEGDQGRRKINKGKIYISRQGMRRRQDTPEETLWEETEELTRQGLRFSQQHC